MFLFLLKAILSGCLVAAISTIAKRYPGWGGLIASLPLVSFVAMLWLWRDGADGTRIADFAISSSAYVIASLPAFFILAAALRRGTAIPIAITLFVAAGFAGYLAMIWVGKRWGLPI